MSAAIEIRDYRHDDGVVCHALRRSAFIETFIGFLPEEAVEAGVDSYDAEVFTERIGSMKTFVAERAGDVAGFCSVRLISAERAEILYLYIHESYRGAGVGTRLVRHAERRVLQVSSAIKTFFLDTAVPRYNQAFWERMGYRYSGTNFCEYPTGKIPSARLEKDVTGSM